MRIFMAALLISATGSVIAAGKGYMECARETDGRPPDQKTEAMSDCLLGRPDRFAKTSTPADREARRQLSLNNEGAVLFAMRHAGKYRQEVEGSRPALCSLMRVLAKMSPSQISGLAEYQSQTQTWAFKPRFAPKVRKFSIGVACKDGRSFVGQNAFGAKARVRVQACDEVFIEIPDHLGISSSGEMPLPPSDYRLIQNIGAFLEVIFKLSSDKDGVVARYWEGVNQATVSNPIQTNIKEWALYGEIEEVRVKSLDGRASYTVYEK